MRDRFPKGHLTSRSVFGQHILSHGHLWLCVLSTLRLCAVLLCQVNNSSRLNKLRGSTSSFWKLATLTEVTVTGFLSCPKVRLSQQRNLLTRE
ncbi:hypothetical protein CEXT_535911 [Caerostris extrusa]|uniref:Secreted protein n=1 Tax=Caerostris extrusa TaxID=172846 RepID=A0AAV4QH58_CAEEX|nr:hypothetical protein CEXT_535911 [Caerostris extrusa]